MHKWLLARPRFHLRFTPTYSSWINQVERWFAELERRCLERGLFCSLEELKTHSKGGPRPGTTRPGPLNGPRPQTRSPTASAATATGSPDQDTRRPDPGRPSAWCAPR
ncbi:transposase [Streptomyces sp. Li-HN-5-11]|uniref:transposase n=1 Tax=Streptomyces sp. Li-HN-5-11 TaxID=3075432 RepID=UPI0028ABFD63|nr:transposase [Streptomyces sp. Li-HN-5-11]WNM30084.1 transposase [Streptomyces sp. Li-HN-5-11]